MLGAAIGRHKPCGLHQLQLDAFLVGRAKAYAHAFDMDDTGRTRADHAQLRTPNKPHVDKSLGAEIRAGDAGDGGLLTCTQLR